VHYNMFLQLTHLGLYSQHLKSFVTFEWPNKQECSITLGLQCFPRTNTQAYWPHLKVKQILINLNTSLGVCKVYTPGAVFTTLHFLHNLQMGPTSLSVALH